MSYTFVTHTERPDLQPQLFPLIAEAWPKFMLEDPVANRNWPRLFSDFPDFQVVLLDGTTIAGAANAIPFAWNDSDDALSEEGWDWGLQSAIDDADAGRTPVTLHGLQIVLFDTYQGRGLSPRFVQQLRLLARHHGLKRLIIPIRPTLKHRYPLTPIDRYLTWQRDDLPFDPWLRVHVKAGARIIKACSRAMTISGSVVDWENWTDMRFPESGQYVIPRALAPHRPGKRPGHLRGTERVDRTHNLISSWGSLD